MNRRLSSPIISLVAFLFLVLLSVTATGSIQSPQGEALEAAPSQTGLALTEHCCNGTTGPKETVHAGPASRRTGTLLNDSGSAGSPPPGPFQGSETSSIEKPVMHPSREELMRWKELYRKAPQAPLSPAIGAKISGSSGTYFSLLDRIEYNSTERDQGICGNCWVWAGTGVMEVDMAAQRGIKDRLSIQYLNSNYRNGKGDAWACCGGWLDYLADLYRGKGKAIPWSNTNAGWQDGVRACEDGSTSVPAELISLNPSYPIASMQVQQIPTLAMERKAAIANVKNVLHQGKAVFFAFFLPTNEEWRKFFRFWAYQPESSVIELDYACGKEYKEGGGHAVLCVGYDDTDPLNGYWIMLNSWGASSNRPAGLFRVRMDMNYDCQYPGVGQAFYWQTLDISYSNRPPSRPSTPTGPGIGYIGNSYKYKTSCTDPDGDRVRYTFDWGDGTATTTDLVPSGKAVKASHSWKRTGTYSVRSFARDEKGTSSDWSGSKTVRIWS